jgi:hypothetical protein
MARTALVAIMRAGSVSLGTAALAAPLIAVHSADEKLTADAVLSMSGRHSRPVE